jgi:hypothetical protein
MVLRRIRFHEYAIGVAACINASWIIIQCILMETINPLHISIFFIGALQGTASLYLLWSKDLFPINVFKHRYLGLK